MAPRFDALDFAERSELMATIQKKNTKPEMTVRRVAHALGYRFRIHRQDLPGTPDIVFPPRHKVIFVHGCFWHRHSCPRGSKTSKDQSRLLATKASAKQGPGRSGSNETGKPWMGFVGLVGM